MEKTKKKKKRKKIVYGTELRFCNLGDTSSIILPKSFNIGIDFG